MDQVSTGAGRGAETPTPTAQAGKYLTFTLSEEIYGLEILKVQEIIGLMSITRVPKIPAFIRGVINLRGKVIPVVELRLKFGMKAVPDDDRTCIIVLRVQRAGKPITMGILVDSVSEVLAISQDLIEDTPQFGAAVDTGFLLGIGKVAQKTVMLLDVNKVLSGDDFAVLDRTVGSD